MRFVKASDRLPEFRKTVAVKIEGQYGVGNFVTDRADDTRFWHNGKNEWIFPNAFSSIEWLDESPSPTDESALKDEAGGLYPIPKRISDEEVYTLTNVRKWQRAAYLAGRRKTIEQKDGEIAALTERLERIIIERNSLEEELALYKLEK